MSNTNLEYREKHIRNATIPKTTRTVKSRVLHLLFFIVSLIVLFL